MNKTKKIVAIVALILCLAFVLCACEGLEDFLYSLTGGSGGGSVHKITVEQTAGKDYDDVDISNFASVVASNTMPAVYEIICFIEYTYSYKSFGGNQTASDQTSSQATAFAVNEEGYLVTNAHAITASIEDLSNEHKKEVVGVTYDERTVYATLADSEIAFVCEIVAYDIILDLAVLKIPSTGNYCEYDRDTGDIVSTSQSYELDPVPYVTFFAHTDPTDDQIETPVNLWYGESVIAIGNAYGYGISVTTGVVSAPYRLFDWDEGTFMKCIQTDVTINSGNSGGPLFNAYCAVIGVNTFKLVDVEIDNMAYAIPTYSVLNWIDGLADGTYSDNTETANSTGVEQALSGKIEIQYYFTTTRAYSSTGQYTSAKYAS